MTSVITVHKKKLCLSGLLISNLGCDEVNQWRLKLTVMNINVIKESMWPM